MRGRLNPEPEDTMPEIDIEDDATPTGGGPAESQESGDHAVEAGIVRLKIAVEFVQSEVPSYHGVDDAEHGRTESGSLVPASIDLVRRRALVAAYGYIEREFSAGGD